MDSPHDSRPTPTIEDYLIILYVMERDKEKAIAARLAEIFEVAPPTVTMTLKRMERDGWITSVGRGASRRSIRLTDSGREAARSVMRRHMLMEWMLVDMLGVPWSRIHEEAHQIEHAISDDIEIRLRESYEDPVVCPHGNPFPGHESATSSWIPLTELSAGQHIVLRRIHEMVEDRPDLLAYLETHKFLPGTDAVVKEVLPFNRTVAFDVLGETVTLGFNTAQKMYAEVCDP